MNVPVVYADESCLTTKLLPKQEWMIKRKNVEIDEKKLNAKTVAFVVALSEDMGLVELSTYPKSLDQWDFINFLKKVRKSYGDRRIGLYMDNAGFHIAKSVRKYCDENNIERIFAPVYSPEYQPCESMIGYLK